MKQIKKIFKYLKNILLKKKDNTIETIFVNKLYLAKAKTKKKFIQNNFFQTFKSTSVDIEFNKRMLKFRENNPEFNFYFFDDIEMDEYMEKNWSHRKIYKIYKDSIFGASKADIWRYCILFQYGGIYLDFESFIEFSLSDIPPNVDEVVSFETNTIESQISREYTPDYNFFTKLPKEHKNVNYPKNLFIQWLLIFKKEHPILRMAIDQIEKNYGTTFWNSKIKNNANKHLTDDLEEKEFKNNSQIHFQSKYTKVLSKVFNNVSRGNIKRLLNSKICFKPINRIN